MTRNESNRIVDELWNGAERIIGTIVDLRARDELPETVAREAGLAFEDLRLRIAEVTADLTPSA